MPRFGASEVSLFTGDRQADTPQARGPGLRGVRFVTNLPAVRNRPFLNDGVTDDLLANYPECCATAPRKRGNGRYAKALVAFYLSIL